MTNQLCAFLGVLAVSAAAAAQTLEQIAPDNTVFAMGVSNVTTTLEGLADHPLFGNLNPDEAAGERLLELLPPEIRDALGGADGGGIPMPKGAVGLSLFAAMNPELGIPEPAFLAILDFGDGIDRVTGRIRNLVENAGDDLPVQIVTRKIENHQVWSIELPELVPADLAAEEDAFGDEDPFGMMMPAPEDLFDIDTIHIVRTGTSLLVGSDLGSVTNGIKAAGGRSDRTLASTSAFQGVVGQVGGTDAYAVVLTGHMMELAAGLDPMGMLQMFQPMIRSAFGDIKGFGYGIEIDNDAPGSFRQTMSVFMPNGKQGLPALLDEPVPATAPPAFVGGDVLSYTSISVEFGNVVGFIDEFIKANPMMQMQMGQGWLDARATIEPIFASLGTHIHSVTTGSPADMILGGGQQVFVVECARPAQLDGVLADMAAAGSVESVEIENGSLYTFAMMGMMVPGMGGDMEPEAAPALGVTGNHVVLGPRGSIEKVMSGAGAEKPLARNPLFDRARGSLPDTPIVAWGYTDMATLLNLGAMFGDVFGADAEGDRPESDEMGAAVWYMQATDDGFVGRFYDLPAAQAVNAVEDSH